MRHPHSSHKRYSALILLFLLMTCAVGSTVRAQDATDTPAAPADNSSAVQQPPADPPTEAPPTPLPATESPATSAPTEPPTSAPTAAPATSAPTEGSPTAVTPETTATDSATQEATPEVTVVVTSTSQPTAEATISVDTPTPTPSRNRRLPNGDAVTEACTLNITDAGDTNAFTFAYAAVNAVGITSFDWDFGDGGTATGATASHTYASTGTYSVKLTCNTASGGTLVLNGSITITSIVSAAFALSPGLSGYAPFTVYLTDTSIGTNLTYQWSVTGPETFSSTSPNPSFTFTQYGSYTIRLTVTDGAGKSDSAEATVVVAAKPPKADFTLSQVSGTPPLAIDITGVDGGGGPIDTWDWSFGDGTTATGQGPFSHTFNIEGTYTIVLNYSGPGGNGSVTKQVGVYALSEPVDAQFSYTLMGNDPGGGVKVCFYNESTGPIATNIWNFGDGSGDVTDNNSTVCHVFANGGLFTVTLKVIASDISVHSTATRFVTVTAAPQAQFTASSTSVVWGDTIDFDSSPSTGVITDYAWDFNGDGTTDSTTANPTGIPFNSLGSIPVRLTVTGPGGSSTAEMLISVARRDITCNFTGSLTATPGQSLPYDATVSGLMGRAVTYTWAVSGPNGTSVFTTEDVTIPFSGEGTYTVTFLAQASDGADCAQTKTVQVAWPTLTCSLGGPTSAVPNGSNNTYTATVNNLAGRTATYQWYVDGVLQPEITSSIIRSWNTPTTASIKVVIGTTDGSGNCTQTKTVQVAWPTLTCAINGNLNPIPQLPDDPSRSYTYTANPGGVAGRTIVSYEWKLDGVVKSTTNSLNLSWPWDQTGTYTLVLTVVVDNRDGTTSNCSKTVTLHVVVPTLQCGLPIGDTTPVLNETVTYLQNLTNQYGRTITAQSWELQQSDGAGGFTPVATGANATFPYQFIYPDTQYRIRYSVSVTQPDESCTSAWQTIQSAVDGEDFSCDAWYSGNASPANPASSYTYAVTIDNTNGFLLKYTWVLVDPFGGERVLGSNQSTIDGNVSSPAFSGANFSPADNYTLRVDVAAVNPSDSAYTCSLSKALTVGTLTVDYTYNVNASAVEVGQAICLTNISTTSHGDIDSLSYQWDFGTASNSLNSQTSSAQQPGCLSYSNPGVYTITLTGTNASGQRSASKSYTFQVYGSQSIAINRSTETTAPATMTFTAVSVNVNAPYTWTFRNRATNTVIGTRTGKTVTFFFNNPGQYEAQVSASGPLGTTTATSQFELIATDDIRAAFRPSAFGGLAPLTVCFTDRSVGNNITDWSWDFGNGQSQSYTSANKPSSICTTYTTPATAYVVTLLIRNSSGRTATATNVIRTFNLVEANATFTIQPQGSGRFCFTSQVDPGITVTEWEFGDGATITIGDLGHVCHTYQASGSYLVTMHITNGTITGQVTRPVDVNLTTTVQPVNLSVSGSCSAGLVATFTVMNTGGDMTVPDRVTIRDESGAVILVDDYLQLKNGESKTYTVSGYYGTVSFSTLDTGVSATANCAKPPMLSGTASCAADGTAVFTITNSSPDTAANQSYEIRDASTNLVASGTLTTAANGGSTEIKVQNVYGPLTFTSSGTPAASTTLNLSTNCQEPPVLHLAGTCAADGTAIFTVSNTSKDRAANQGYEIRDGLNNLITSGTLTTAANGGTTEIKVQNIYGPLTFTSSGPEGVTTQISASTDCKEPPVLHITGTCAVDGTAIFTVSNTSKDRAANQSYEIRDASNSLITSGTLTTAANGGTTEIKVQHVYGPLTFTSSGPEGVTTHISASTNCKEPPVLHLAGTCAVDGMAVFTVTNTSRDTAAHQVYEVHDINSTLVAAGTLTTAINGGTSVIKVANVYGPLTFTSSGSQGVTTQISGTTNCDEPPVLKGSASCTADGLATFIIQNTSAGSDASQPYEVRSSTKVVQTGSLTIPKGGNTQVQVKGVFDVLTLTTSGPQGATTQLTLKAACADTSASAVNVSGLCTASGAAFMVSNTGKGSATQPYVIVDAGGVVVQSGTLTIPGGSGVLVSVNTTSAVTFQSGAVVPVSMNCAAGTGAPANAQPSTSSPNPNTKPGKVRRFFPTPDLTPGTPDPSLPRSEPWQGITVGGAVCTDWLLYHTNMPGPWNIYRLGPLVKYPQASPNLSQGKGREVIDMAPTRSPDTEWVAFTSNRDGNWELYIAKVDNSIIRRVTFNTHAKDIDPVWSPDGKYIAFESDRDGNWELYLLNLATGEEKRLTDHPASDINAFWSADSRKIAFQSDRDGRWQVYEKDIATGIERRISDGLGDDVDPAYSFDGKRIAFRSYRDGNSVIYLMNADGTDVHPISDLRGSASNHTWYMDDSIIAYQSDLDGDLDIYIYELKSEKTRLVTDNTIPDYAPTWECGAPIVVFTSDVTEDPNIFNTPALPITADSIIVEKQALQMTFDKADDVYPEYAPSEENASREDRVPSHLFAKQ
jgi:PKD repeat protein/Tol biopolymer transport system component